MYKFFLGIHDSLNLIDVQNFLFHSSHLDLNLFLYQLPSCYQSLLPLIMLLIKIVSLLLVNVRDKLSSCWIYWNYLVLFNLLYCILFLYCFYNLRIFNNFVIITEWRWTYIVKISFSSCLSSLSSCFSPLLRRTNLSFPSLFC